jgi:hypothetical protein
MADEMDVPAIVLDLGLAARIRNDLKLDGFTPVLSNSRLRSASVKKSEMSPGNRFSFLGIML